MNWFDFEELLCGIVDIPDEQRNDDNFDIDDLCFEQFNVSFDAFMNIASALLPLTPTVKSELSGYVYHAFIKNGCALIKTEIKHG